MRQTASLIFVILVSVWAGVVIGVSLISTPVKFQAPSLTMPVALEIGRYTFRFLGRIEVCLLVAAIAAATLAHPRPVTLALLGLIFAAMLLERLWLLPVLDQRVSEVLAGNPPPPTIHHGIFAVMEGAKAALLVAAAALEYRSHAG